MKVTTGEEEAFLAKVRDVCSRAGEAPENLLSRDTQSWFNVSYKSAWRWFVRFFGDGRRKAITTLVPVDEAMLLATGFQVEQAPASFGVSRVYVESVDQVVALSPLIVRSLEICRAGRPESHATG